MNQEPTNPYAAIETFEVQRPFVPLPEHLAMLRHVKIVRILLIVQAVLELLMGAMLVAVGVFMSAAIDMRPPGTALPPGQEEMFAWMEIFYGIFGAVVALIALFRMVAGLCNLWWRGYWLAVVSMFVGLASSFTCYCAPFSIGICIYGLVIYFHPAVVRAFQLAREGKSEAEIFRYFESSTQ